jgi:hypothetical protein
VRKLVIVRVCMHLFGMKHWSRWVHSIMSRMFSIMFWHEIEWFVPPDCIELRDGWMDGWMDGSTQIGCA